ncbi:hypothetical protein AWW66_16700 [Micromonospora rosaria]|uniref:Prevent-host-death protein n=1 Tax=Micromonospora rosaria TaxID=47874 RepID=A0A136PR46_9ACTN|nr:hypothetical protein [Micromonospora rosaria]KXK60858.1 hypothetical protein AWW66_16700 [Micromonospora rosaria]
MPAPPVAHQRKVIIEQVGTPVEEKLPPRLRVNRTAVGSLAGQLDLSGDWDSPRTDADIAADFDIGV